MAGQAGRNGWHCLAVRYGGPGGVAGSLSQDGLRTMDLLELRMSALECYCSSDREFSWKSCSYHPQVAQVNNR